MKNLFSGILIAIAVFITSQTFAQQIAPYSVPPKWRFGYQGGMNFPVTGAPTVAPGFVNNDGGQENSNTMVDTLGNVVFSTNSFRLFDGNNVQKQTTEGGTSSTGGAISIPDPNSPFDQFYLFTANVDPGGGGAAGPNKGVNYYHIKSDGGGNITVLSGPVQLATAAETDESIGSSSDGNGGYWIIAHQRGGKSFYSWHVTSAGVNPTRKTSTGTNTTPSATYQGSIKISQCQKRIAYVSWAGFIEVREWDSVTGQVGAQLLSKTTPGFSYGAEFSPNGEMVYYTVLLGTTRLAQYEIATGTETILSTTSSNNIGELGTMQIGPDNKIYVTNVAHDPGSGQVFIGVINDPNNAGDDPVTGCHYDPQGFLLKSTSSTFNRPSIYRGIVNEAWINPTLNLDTIGNCKTIKMVYDFKTYYRQLVSVATGSEEWDFGDGSGFQTGLGASPSFTFTPGPHTVTLKVTDAVCGKVWTASLTFTVNDCSTGTNPGGTCNITAVISAPADNSVVTINDTDPFPVNFDGSTSMFDNTSTDPHKFYWMKGSPDTSAAIDKSNKPTITFQHGSAFPEGIYDIYLVIRQGSCLDTTHITLKVENPTTTPTCTFDLEPVIKGVDEVMVAENMPATITLDGTSSVFDPASASAKQYYWIIGDQDITHAFSTNPTANVTFSLFGKGSPLQGSHLPQGAYDIYLVIKQGLCTEFTKIHVKVTYLYIPNLVTPNGDGKNDKFVITNTPGRFNVVIYNRWGQAVYKEDGYTDGWNMHDMSDGIYFYEVTDTKVSETYKGWVNLIRSN